jgi:hypothetical protein
MLGDTAIISIIKTLAELFVYINYHITNVYGMLEDTAIVSIIKTLAELFVYIKLRLKVFRKSQFFLCILQKTLHKDFSEVMRFSSTYLLDKILSFLLSKFAVIANTSTEIGLTNWSLSRFLIHFSKSYNDKASEKEVSPKQFESLIQNLVLKHVVLLISVFSQFPIILLKKLDE